MLFEKSGFSMMEVLVAIGVGSIVAAAMGSLTIQMNRDIRNLNNKLEVQGSGTSLQNVLKNKNICTSQLAGKKISNGGKPTIADLYEGAKVGQNVKIKKMSFSNVKPVAGVPNGYQADLTVHFEDANSNNIIYKPQEYRMYYTTGTGGNVLSCGGGDLAEMETDCTNVGGIWDGKKDTCDIVSPVCLSLGGTMKSGSCEGVGASPKDSPETYKNCTASTRPASESTQKKETDSGTDYWPMSCSIGSGSHNQFVTGKCKKGGDRHFGSCVYQCNDGQWSVVMNTCGAHDSGY